MPYARTTAAPHSFLNISYTDPYQDSREIIGHECLIEEICNNFRQLEEWTSMYPDVFADKDVTTIQQMYIEAREIVESACPEAVDIDINTTDSYVYLYALCGDLKIFFNLFFDDDEEPAQLIWISPSESISLSGTMQRCGDALNQLLQSEQACAATLVA